MYSSKVQRLAHRTIALPALAIIAAQIPLVVATLGRVLGLTWCSRGKGASQPDSPGGDKKTERAATKPDSQGGVWQ